MYVSPFHSCNCKQGSYRQVCVIFKTLRHPKMHLHTKFGFPTSKDIGDMHRTRSGTDRLMDSVIIIWLPKFLWGHNKQVAQWAMIAHLRASITFGDIIIYNQSQVTLNLKQ